jgi:hypothetical protein
MEEGMKKTEPNPAGNWIEYGFIPKTGMCFTLMSHTISLRGDEIHRDEMVRSRLIVPPVISRGETEHLLAHWLKFYQDADTLTAAAIVAARELFSSAPAATAESNPKSDRSTVVN